MRQAVKTVAVVASLLASASLARADPHSDCAQTTDRERAIVACTAVMKEAGRDNAKLLAAYSNRSLAYQAKGEHRLAISDLTRALVYSPRDPQLWYRRGLSRSALGQNIRCAADFSLALRYDTRMANALLERGECYRKLGALPRAIADQTEVLKLDPKSATAYANRAYAQLRLGQLDKAVADADEAIKLDPRSARGYLARGLAREKKDKTQAASDVKKALELDPKLKDARELQDALKRLGP
jgi:tetratricopeptide (TPR) repeat protein